MTHRRRFLIAAGTALFGVSRLARAQSSSRVYRVAFVSSGTLRSPWVSAFGRRFRELGYVEGKNLVFDARGLGEHRDKLPEAVAELARAKPDVAIASGSESILRALRQAMGATPIVMIAVDYDPVEKNYIASLARPGGNITGVYLRQVESAAKRLELLKEALPNVTRVAALFDHATRDQLRAAQEVAAKLGVALVPQELRGNPYDFAAALAAAVSARAQAVLALSSGAFFPQRDRMISAAHSHRLPVIANPNYAEAGALVAFGASFPHMYVRAAEYADRILKGVKPAEIPVEQASQYDLIVNLKTARTLGLTISQRVLVRATRVIE